MRAEGKVSHLQGEASDLQKGAGNGDVNARIYHGVMNIWRGGGGDGVR